MADDDIETEDEERSEDGGSKTPRKTPGKTLVFSLVLPAMVLIAAGMGAYFGGALDRFMGDARQAVGAESDEAETARVDPKDLIYYELPEMLVNLSGDGQRTHFLKIKVSLELTNSADVERVEAVLPRIVDNFQVYLREMRVEDLQGSAGLYRLREELLTRVTLAAAPAEVSDVLFREMIVQ